MSKSSVLIDLDNPKVVEIAEIISNKTSRKILNLIADEEMSEGDISKKLGVPANTVNYNMKKLVSAGLVEKSRNFFWSVKGKKVELYRVSDKRIIINPKKFKNGILPVALISLILAGIVRGAFEIFGGSNGFDATRVQNAQMYSATVYSGAAKASGAVSSNSGWLSGNSWSWFLLGAWVVLVIFVIWGIMRRENA